LREKEKAEEEARLAELEEEPGGGADEVKKTFKPKIKNAIPFESQLRALEQINSRIANGQLKLNPSANRVAAASITRTTTTSTMTSTPTPPTDTSSTMSTTLTDPNSTTSSDNRLMSLLSDEDEAKYPDSRTTNGAPAFSTAGCARMDLFFGGLVRGADAEIIIPLLEKGWLENPEHVVQLLMHARDCRGGKGEREVVLIGLMWLRAMKPGNQSIKSYGISL
jgi:hypothetical protein